MINNELDKVFERVDYTLVRPNQLVPLLEIMKRFSASDFAVVHATLEIMFGFGGHKFKWDDPLLKGCFAEILKHCEHMGCDLSAMYVKQMQETLLKEGATGTQLEEMAKTLQGRLEDELKKSFCFIVTAEEAKYYMGRKLFGANVVRAFPSAIMDIEEAGKCLALSRNTASVMHLARVVEIALKAVRTALDLPPLPVGKQMNWGEILRQIWDEIGVRNRAADPIWMAEQKPFFENIHSDLSSVKNAWRNPSVHADMMYDAERAADIFDMTKSFMRHLAAHLDESGVFTP